jgi:hypothetical protein
MLDLELAAWVQSVINQRVFFITLVRTAPISERALCVGEAELGQMEDIVNGATRDQVGCLSARRTKSKLTAEENNSCRAMQQHRG